MLSGAVIALYILSFLAVVYSIAVIWSLQVVYNTTAIRGVQQAVLLVANVLLGLYVLGVGVFCFCLATFLGGYL